ncbi:MAG TPA: isoprenylcysteine carboxylmethyltransferase family protein [Thermoguttaceae bacterium]|nr:isoprenylcysteine carboxylmethyltransferase family protein [Thermoguttaceae bacterium]
MALREEFENSGNWLFRWRSYIPLVMIGMFVFALRERQYSGPRENFDYLWEGFCLFVGLLGLGIRAITIGHTPKGTSGRNTKKQVAHSLNTTGIYSVVRNPLYLGNFCMGLGVALFAQLWWLAVIFVLAFWLYYERIIFAEEAFLRNKFGDEYLQWANRTPVFIPHFRNYEKADLPFSMKNVLRREYNGFFALISVMFVLETVQEYLRQERIAFDIEWVAIFGCAFIIWMTLRTLKKYTTVLNVSGR